MLVMEFDAEKGLAKYSKLKSGDIKASIALTQEDSAAKWASRGNENSNDSKIKVPKPKLKVGLLLAFLMIFIGLVAGLIIMNMKIQILNSCNQTLVQDLESQKQIVNDFKAKNQTIMKTTTAFKNQSDTDLFTETKKGDIEAIKVLLENGANVNVRDQNLQTPLFYAARYGKAEIAELLIQNGADVHVKNLYHNQTPLYDASATGYLNVLQVLIHNGANIDAVDRDGDTPLHIAARMGRSKIIKELLQNGANINASNYYLETPLKSSS